MENSTIEKLGHKFHGSPYSLKYDQWAFKSSEENLKKIWNEIPENVDILITHGTQKYIADYVDEIFTGSDSLLDEVVNRIKPKYHIFGHIHNGY